MQVRGLPRQIIRGARVASKIAAEPINSEAAIRRDVLRRWRRAIGEGLTAASAARAVGISRATLYRWEKRSEPRSRRPHRLRRPVWSSALVRAIEHLRDARPMWGKAKLGPLLRAEGLAVSDATVGRVLKSLMARGVIQPVPVLRRRPQSHHWTARRHYAVRLPKGLKADKPGGLIQIDTVFVTLAPGKAIKHFTAYCPVAKWTVAKAFNRAPARAASLFLDKVLAQMPFPVEAVQVDSNVGKSSLLNRLLGRKLAHTSSTPGRTQTVNWFRIDRRYWFVDLPGYGFARRSREAREKWAEVVDTYHRRESGPRLVVLLVDSAVGATRLDQEAARYRDALGVERMVAATKIDRVKRGARAGRLAEIRRDLGFADGTEIVPVSTTSGEGLRELWKHIADFLAGPVPSQKGKERQQRNAQDDGTGIPG